MRSAETSGVEGNGFGARRKVRPFLKTLTGRLTFILRRFVNRFSPVTLAVAGTALLAATISIGVDAARTAAEAETVDTAQHRQVLNVASGQPVALWHYAGSATGQVTASVVVDDEAAAFVGVAQRGAGAFALALLAIGATMVRRRPSPDPAARRYEILLAPLPFGAACWTAEGRLVACNDHYRARLNLEEAELRQGSSYRAAVKRLAHGGYMQLLSEDDTSRLIEVHREDGSCLMIDERPLGDGGFITLVTDITERRRTDDLLNSIREEQRHLARRYHEEKLRAEAASRSKTSFLAHLSHDIRTPLNHIIGFAEMMRQQTYGPLGDKRYLGYVDDMKESGERLLSFFASILELAELESGQKPLRAEPFSVDEMLLAVTRRFSAQAQRAGLALSLGSACGSWLTGDRFALERMVGNVVENAVRFTRAGGRVSIAAYAAANGVVLEITDTGVGMSPERLEALSQPFAFGDAALTRQHGGSGLGIAIARAIAELSGGRLAIDSRLALGTTVAISLPLPEAAGSVKAA